MNQSKVPSPRPEDCPTYWFVILDRARMDDDFERAAQAQRELKRLGVNVRFHRIVRAREVAR